MFGTKGDSPKRAGSFMPPATTRRLPERPVTSTREARIAPPFIPSGGAQPQPAPEPEPEPYLEANAEPDEPPPAPEPEPLGAFAPSNDAQTQPALEPWEEVVADSEGIVEPVFEADSDAALEELTAAYAPREEFPLDAFIVPEETQHVPSGLEGAPATPPPEPTAAKSLAERLEKLSHRLRVEDSDAIVRRLASGDRLDALLAGLLAGYLAGKSEQP
jgi:hypothetical protein